MIKHVWFDLEGTLTIRSDEFNEAHNQFRYKTYMEVVGKPLTKELKQEFETLAKTSEDKMFWRLVELLWKKNVLTEEETRNILKMQSSS